MTYNFVFKELVKDRDDVRGALAYVLYKNEKVEYIENYAKQHGSLSRMRNRLQGGFFTRTNQIRGLTARCHIFSTCSVIF